MNKLTAVVKEEHSIVWDTREFSDPWKVALGLVTVGKLQEIEMCARV
jgi:hypothetical protein